MKLLPVCSSGTPLKLAVSAAGTLCDTAATYRIRLKRLLLSCPPVPVQIAPASLQARPPNSMIDTLPSTDGATVNVHRSARPSTRAAPVTEPPVTVSAWSRISTASASMSSLNSIWKLKALSPSCDCGRPSKLAVSGSAIRRLPVLVQIAPGPLTVTVASDGLATA